MKNFIDDIYDHLRSVRTSGYHNGRYNQGYDDGLDMAIAILDMLTIRCKDCKNVHFDTTFKEYWCNGKKVPMDHFCGYAKKGE